MFTKCQKCGKKLTDPESMARGYGPECWSQITGEPPDSNAKVGDEDEISGQMNIFDCPECGTREAIDAALSVPEFSAGMTEQEKEEYKENVIRKIHENI